VKSSFVGPLPKEAYSMLNLSTMSLFVMMAIPFLRRIWRIKVSLRVTFFAWSAALGKILTMDNLRKQHVLWLIGVVCVRETGSLWIIFFSIVRLPVLYGILSSVVLGCLVSCLDKYSTCLLVGGGYLVTLRVQLCGRWYLHAYCGGL
jgi:hypothetical protein